MMNAPEESVQLLDYRQEQASHAIVPKPAVLASAGWDNLHFELHQQPTFETAEHTHTMHVLACGLSGGSVGDRWLDGKRTSETRNLGDIAMIPTGVTHRCNWSEPSQFMILAIDPSLLQQMGQDWVKRDRIELIPQYMTQPDLLLQGIFSALRDELECHKIASQSFIDSVKTTLAIHLLRNYCSTQPSPFRDTSGLSQSCLNRVKDYIHHHLHQEIKLSELAAIAQISPYHFLRLFKQRLGMTPHQYILHYRIETAKSLLQHSQLSISDIAVRVGFYDQSHLTRYFKRVVGMTPRQLLRQGRSQ